jgi:hypothetical protein
MREATEKFYTEEHEEFIRKNKKKNRWMVYYEGDIHQKVRNDFKSFIKNYKSISSIFVF